jgi:hypothetical protein
MNLHLVSFGAPEKKYASTKNKFHNEALNLEVFKSINIFSDNDFNNYPDLKEHENYCKNTPKIFGNGLWKWYLILKIMKEIPKNEIISYVDIGCTFNKFGIDRIYDYYNIVNEKDNLSFSLPYPEAMFTKMDTYRKVFPYSDEHFYSKHILSGIIFLKNTVKNQEIIEELKSLSIENEYHYINDHPSVLKNDPIFSSHRHDQSIFSLMNKKYNFFSIPDETYWHPNWDIDGKKYPIWATRNVPR